MTPLDDDYHPYVLRIVLRYFKDSRQAINFAIFTASLLHGDIIFIVISSSPLQGYFSGKVLDAK